MDVALHRAQHDGAELLGRGLGGEVRLHLGGDALHDLAGHDELGEERLAARETLADDVHGVLAGRHDGERVGPARQQLVGDPQRVLFAQLDHGLLQFVRHRSSPIGYGGSSVPHDFDKTMT